MKKTLNTLFVVMAILLALVACSLQNEVTDELVSVTLTTTDNMRSLVAEVDFDISNVKTWKYTAEKADNGLKTGSTTTEVELKSGKTELLSQGSWNFNLYGYNSNGKLICSGSIENATVTTTKHDVKITVKPSQTAIEKGTIAIADDIQIVDSTGNVYDKGTGDDEYTKTVTVTNNSDSTAVTLPEASTNGLKTASVYSGLYKIVVSYTATAEDGTQYTAATATKYVNVYDNLTTTVSGTITETSQQADVTSVGGTVKAEVKREVEFGTDGKNTTAVEFSTKTTSTSSQSSSETETKTEEIKVSFPAGSITNTNASGSTTTTKQDVSLKVEKASVEAANTTYSVDTADGGVVAGFDFDLVGFENPTFAEGVTITTTIEKGITGTLSVKYVGEGGKAPDNLSYNSETGVLTFKVYHFSNYVITSDSAAFLDTIDGKVYSSLSEAIGSKTKASILVLKDITVGENETWTSLTLTGTSMEYKEITIDGNNHTITGLNATLFERLKYVKMSIRNLYIDKADIKASASWNYKSGDDRHVGMGALISYIDNSEVTIDNCKLTSSKLTSDYDLRVGGLVGYIIKNDTKATSKLTVSNCVVDDTDITTNGTVGGLVGHIYTADAVIKNSTASNCELKSTDSGDWRVGSAVGTFSLKSLELTAITESGNTLSQLPVSDDIVVNPHPAYTVYGRMVNTDGTLSINGSSITADTSFLCSVTYFKNDNRKLIREEYYQQGTVPEASTMVANSNYRYYKLEGNKLVFYVGTAGTLTFGGTTEKYDYVVQSDEYLRMEIDISNYSGLKIGGTAYDGTEHVTDTNGTKSYTAATDKTRFTVLMKVTESGVEYQFSTDGKTFETQKVEFTKSSNGVRYGFVVTATSGSVSSVQVQKVKYTAAQ